MPFDINQPYGLVAGDGTKSHYVQGGVYYDVNGVQVTVSSSDPLATQPTLRDHHAAHQAMGNVVNYTTNPVTGGIGFVGYGDKAGVAAAYHVEAFRKTGMNDSDVINAALRRIESDGVAGSRLVFEGGRLYEYTSSAQLGYINNLDIDLNGAVLQRANASSVSSTLSSQLSATWPSGGVIFLQYIPNNWIVGDFIAAIIDNTYNGTSSSARITGIDRATNSVSINASLTLSGYDNFPVGTTISKSFSCFSGRPSNTDSGSIYSPGSNKRVRIHGGEIDGNRSNQLSNSWRFSNEILLHTEGGAIYDMKIHDTKGECIVGHGFDIGGGGRCTFTDLDGSAVHLSCNDETASLNTGAILRGNIFKRTNLATNAVNGHCEGAVTFSWGPGNLIVSDNVFDGGSEAILGTFGTSGGANASMLLVVIGNKCRNYAKIFNSVMSSTYGVNISGNSFHDCGDNTDTYAAFAVTKSNIISSNAISGGTIFESASIVPTVRGSTVTGSATYGTQNFNYDRIGNRIFFDAEITWSGHSGAGSLRVAGLPANVKNTAICSVVYSNVVVGTGKEVGGILVSGGNYIYLYQMDSAGGVMNQLPMDAAGTLYISGSYQIQ